MTLDAEAFTALIYGLLALVAILYVLLLRAFLHDRRDEDAPEDTP